MTDDKAHTPGQAHTRGPGRTEEIDPIAAIARRHDPERFLAALTAPEDRRRHLFALLAFEHEIARVRETVSEPVLGEIRLQWWSDALERIGAGASAPAHEVAGALALAVSETPLDVGQLRAMVEARLADLDEAPPATLEDLLSYADATGGGVARAMATILAPDDADSVRAASLVGTAWSLTGVIRALPFGQGRRRLFLPADALAHAGLTVETIRPGPALAAVVRTVADAARARLAEARAMRVARAATPALLSARLADVHLRRLARAGHDAFAPSFQRPDGFRAARVAFAAWTGRW